MKLIKNKRGFTLAEVLVTLAILGVIAALALPRLMDDVSSKSWDASRDEFIAKLEAATSQMNVNEVLPGTVNYTSNAQFVTEFQKYLKIPRVCTGSLDDCFVSTFKKADGTEVSLSSLSDGKDLDDSNNSYDLVGVQLLSGVNAIVALTSSCAALNPYELNRSGSSSYNRQGTGVRFTPGPTTTCISMIYDVNGFKGPNKIGKDIYLFHASKLASESSNFDCDSAGGTLVAGGSLCIGGSDIDASVPSNVDCGDMHLPTVAELSTLISNSANWGLNNLVYVGEVASEEECNADKGTWFSPPPNCETYVHGPPIETDGCQCYHMHTALSIPGMESHQNLAGYVGALDNTSFPAPIFARCVRSMN